MLFIDLALLEGPTQLGKAGHSKTRRDGSHERDVTWPASQRELTDSTNPGFAMGLSSKGNQFLRVLSTT